MFYATGDTHGDWTRLKDEHFPKGKGLTADDYLFVLGDFGVWDGSAREQRDFDWLASKPYTICFISGNHENYDMLDQMEIKEWHGGAVNFIRDNVIHLRRGQIYNINGMNIFTFGGARSHDIQDGVLDANDPEFEQKKEKLDGSDGRYRVNHQSWWQQEIPSVKEMLAGIENLKAHDWKVDYILSHCATSSFQQQLDDGAGIYQPDILTEYLERIGQETDYKWWLFGHYHCNCKLSEKEFALYEQIIRIPDGPII